MQKKYNKELSIIIVSFGGIDYLEKCLLSLHEKIGSAVGHEIILVNNDKSADISSLADKFSGIIIVNSDNKGFGAGNNLGNKYAKGELLLFLNPDAKVASDNARSVIELFNKDATLGIVGSRLMLLDGKTQEWSCGRAASLRELIKNNLRPSSGRRPWLEKRVLETDWVSGTSLFIRKELFEKLGGFDESFFMYFEDMDLCERARRAGYKVAYNPDFSILHYGGKSYTDKKKQKADYYNSQEYYFKKHYGSVHAAILKFFRMVLFK